MRLMLKTTTYGLMHLCIATAVAYAITGNLAMALSIGIIEPFVQTFAFAGHDWLWEKKFPNKGRSEKRTSKPCAHSLNALKV